LNLILLLSALLSALCGTGGVRAPVTPAALSSSVASVVEATAKQLQVAARPVQAVGGPVASVVPVMRAFALADIVPAYASRRRE